MQAAETAWVTRSTGGAETLPAWSIQIGIREPVAAKRVAWTVPTCWVPSGAVQAASTSIRLL